MLIFVVALQVFCFLTMWIPGYFVYKKEVYMLLSGFNTKP